MTKIDAALVQRLIRTQFPQWAELAVEPVENGGWAIWKALITLAEHQCATSDETKIALQIIDEVLADHSLSIKQGYPIQ
jgi:aminoglycoside phosphotransferase (APT) family kinase protein